MKRVTRFSAILLALMLAVASISGNHHAPLLKTVVQDTEGGHHTSYFSEKKQQDVYSNQRQSETRLNPVNKLPVPGSKIQAGDFLGATFTLELRKQTLIAHYLALSRQLSPNLNISLIIFPFHYFW